MTQEPEIKIEYVVKTVAIDCPADCGEKLKTSEDLAKHMPACPNLATLAQKAHPGDVHCRLMGLQEIATKHCSPVLAGMLPNPFPERPSDYTNPQRTFQPWR